MSSTTGNPDGAWLERWSGRIDVAAALAGVVAAAAAIGVSELLAGLIASSSLVAAVGQVVIDLQPPGEKDFVVALFGTNDKLALEIVVVTVSTRVDLVTPILSQVVGGTSNVTSTSRGFIP